MEPRTGSRLAGVWIMVGLVVGFVIFGFFAIGLGSEVFTRSVDLDRIGGFVIMLAISVPLGWVVVARIARRNRAAWHDDCVRAGALAAGLFAIACGLLAASIVQEVDGDLAREVYFTPSSRSHRTGWYWPAIFSVIVWSIIALASAAGSLGLWRLSLPKRSEARRDR